MKNPIKLYLNYLRKSIEPKDATHDVSMNIEIPKGKTEGRVLIPCATYTLSHSIDLNPALIRKKDKKFIKKLPVKKRIEFDSNKYDVVLTEEEKEQGYELNELRKSDEKIWEK